VGLAFWLVNKAVLRRSRRMDLRLATFVMRVYVISNFNARLAMLMPNERRPSLDPAAVRDFIASTADELAQLARETGDRRLALLLDTAASFAETPEITAPANLG